MPSYVAFRQQWVSTLEEVVSIFLEVRITAWHSVIGRQLSGINRLVQWIELEGSFQEVTGFHSG